MSSAEWATGEHGDTFCVADNGSPHPLFLVIFRCLRYADLPSDPLMYLFSDIFHSSVLLHVLKSL